MGLGEDAGKNAVKVKWNKVAECYPQEEGLYIIATKCGHVGYVVLENVTPQAAMAIGQRRRSNVLGRNAEPS